MSGDEGSSKEFPFTSINEPESEQIATVGPSESTTTKSTATESTATESTATESTATESIAAESTAAESTATESTATESTAAEATTSKSTKSGDDYIRIRVMSSDDTNQVVFRVKAETGLGRLKRSYCTKIGLNIHEVRFVFDGVRITDDDTPKRLGLIDEDVIEVYQEKIGGM